MASSTDGVAESEHLDTLPQFTQQETKKRPAWDTAETLERYWRTRKTFFTHEQRAEAWTKTAENLQKYSDEMIDRWNKEIDTLLVFAGLFSAILTAFNVQSYQLLTPPPETDPVIVALERISAQLSSFSVNPPSVNSTQPAFVYRNPTPSPAAQWAVWLNALWFSSLIFSLSSASIGIMVKQWLNEYNAGLSGTPRHMARLRRLRLDSLQRWRVREIVAMLPVLLQIASALFFAGLLVLLWHLNTTVAIVGSVFVATLVIFSVSTIVLPSVATHCSYLSPPSRAVFRLSVPLRRSMYALRFKLCSWIVNHYCSKATTRLPEWEADEEEEQLQSLQRVHPLVYRVRRWVHPDDEYPAHDWQGKERSIIARLGDALDTEVITTAYTSTMDTNYLHHAAVCITELSLDATRRCFVEISAANSEHWGEDSAWTMRSEVHPSLWTGALISFMTIPSDNLDWSQPQVVDALKKAYNYIGPTSRHVKLHVPWTRLVCVDLARILRHYDHTKFPADALNVAEAIWETEMQSIMNEVFEMTRNLGHDVRQHVASFCSQHINRTHAEDDAESLQALIATSCILRCLPVPGSPDYAPDNPDYGSVRSQAVAAMDSLSRLLSTPFAREFEGSWVIGLGILPALRRHGAQNVDLLSPKLIRATHEYLVAYKTEHDRLPDRLQKHTGWIQNLQRNLPNS